MPYRFRALKIGPLIGKRTWVGLVGFFGPGRRRGVNTEPRVLEPERRSTFWCAKATTHSLKKRWRCCWPISKRIRSRFTRNRLTRCTGNSSGRALAEPRPRGNATTMRGTTFTLPCGRGSVRQRAVPRQSRDTGQGGRRVSNAFARRRGPTRPVLSEESDHSASGANGRAVRRDR